jgi:hypothetical protein
MRKECAFLNWQLGVFASVLSPGQLIISDFARLKKGDNSIVSINKLF